MRGIYANTHIQEVLIGDEEEPATQSNSHQKGAGRLLSGFVAKHHRKSLPENVLGSKENRRVINRTSQEICAKKGKENII